MRRQGAARLVDTRPCTWGYCLGEYLTVGLAGWGYGSARAGPNRALEGRRVRERRFEAGVQQQQGATET